MHVGHVGTVLPLSVTLAGQPKSPATRTQHGSASEGQPSSTSSPGGVTLGDALKARLAEEEAARQQERAVIQALKKQDREVRAHEQAHASVGGPHAGAPTYTFQQGPDGVNYAVAGEVKIDASSVPGDPEATLRKARQVKAAALAPANPSPQDRAVAAKATRMEAQARVDLAEETARRGAEAAENKLDGGAESPSNAKEEDNSHLAKQLRDMGQLEIIDLGQLLSTVV